MAEYYAVLSKAVAGLEANSADARRAVYDKARNALIGQLKAIDPPLPTAEISRQRLELEEAIRRVERETSSVPSGAPVRVAPSKRTPAPERAASPSPQDVFRRAIQEAEGTAPDAPPRAERAVAVRADDWSSDRIDRPTPPPAKPVPQYLPSQGYVEEKPRSDEPRLAPDYDYDWDPKAPPQPKPRTAEPTVVADGRSAPSSVKSEKRLPPPRNRADARDVERPSRLPMILLLVLIVAMVGGLGAFAYAYRTQLGDLARGFDSKTPAAPQATADAPPPADTSGKDTDSLLSGAQPTPVPDARVVGASTDTGNAADTTAAADQPAPVPPTQTASVDPDSLVAQHATLYEEPLNSATAATGVVAISAAVTWSLGNGPEGAEIVGNIDVPERGLKIKMTVRRNSDKSLPASHVVEVVIDTPANFPGKGIKDVPRVVLKPSEEARGQPLIGASAKVADGFFWIALSGEAQDLKSNVKLLQERTWIDLPLVYDSGQRAIITLEKGTPGERVFEKALAAWTG